MTSYAFLAINKNVALWVTEHLPGTWEPCVLQRKQNTTLKGRLHNFNFLQGFSPQTYNYTYGG